MEQEQMIILTGYEARKKIMAGIEKAAKIINSTLGPGGKNVIYESEYNRRVNVADDMYDSQAPTITNDGVRVASKVIFEDPIEDLGAQALFEVSKQQNIEAGDATTTVVTIAHKLIQLIMNKLNEGGELDVETINRMELKRELNKAKDEVIIELKKKAKPVKTLSELENIAMTAGENEFIDKKIAEAWWKVGKDGWVGVEGHKGLETEIEVHEGMRFHAKLMSEYMRTTAKGEMEVKEPLIIVTNHDIEDSEQIKGWIQKATQRLKFDIVLFAPKFSAKATDFINTARAKVEQFNMENKTKGVKAIRLFAIKIPSLTEKEGGQVEDLAIFTGATFIDKHKSMNMEDSNIDYFGYATKVFCDNDIAIVASDSGDVIKRIKDLTIQMNSEKDDTFKNRLKNRIASLSSGIAVVKVGATTDTERRYIKLKTDDAVHSCGNALQDGYIQGAGQVLKKLPCKNEYLKKALEAPYNQIQTNAGNTEIPKWVIDPVKSMILAIERAVSMAGMIITIDTAVAYKRDNDLSKKFDEILKVLKK